MSVNKRFASGAVYTSARLLSEVANTTTLLPPRLITYLLPGAMSRVSLVSFCFFYSHPTLSMVSVFCIFAGWIYLPGIYIYIIKRRVINSDSRYLAFTGVVCYLAIIVWELAIKCHFIHILVVRSRRQTHSYYCSGKNTKSSASKQQVGRCGEGVTCWATAAVNVQSISQPLRTVRSLGRWYLIRRYSNLMNPLCCNTWGTKEMGYFGRTRCQRFPLIHCRECSNYIKCRK